MLDCSKLISSLDFTTEHRLHHRDSVARPEAGTATIGFILRGRCRIHHQGQRYDIGERTPYLLEGEESIVEYITNCTGVFEQLLLHINTKSLFATIDSIDLPTEQRFEHAILRSLSEVMSIEEVASLCCMSLSTFKRYFRTRFRISPHRWMQSFRLQMAYEILSSYDVATEDVANMFGYNNLSYFTVLFRTKHGVTPNCVRQICRHQRTISTTLSSTHATDTLSTTPHTRQSTL
jgi:AraC-like DNA-binding protein